MQDAKKAGISNYELAKEYTQSANRLIMHTKGLTSAASTNLVSPAVSTTAVKETDTDESAYSYSSSGESDNEDSKPPKKKKKQNKKRGSAKKNRKVVAFLLVCILHVYLCTFYVHTCVLNACVLV